jgi:cell division cycle protein 37
MRTIANDVASGGHNYFSSLVERLKTQPLPEAPAQGQPTYDEMLQLLLIKVWEDVKEKGVQKDDPELDNALVDGLQEHVNQLAERQEQIKVEFETEQKEQAKKITSEDIHEGFDSKVSRMPMPGNKC